MVVTLRWGKNQVFLVRCLLGCGGHAPLGSKSSFSLRCLLGCGGHAPLGSKSSFFGKVSAWLWWSRSAGLKIHFFSSKMLRWAQNPVIFVKNTFVHQKSRFFIKHHVFSSKTILFVKNHICSSKNMFFFIKNMFLMIHGHESTHFFTPKLKNIVF